MIKLRTVFWYSGQCLWCAPTKGICDGGDVGTRFRLRSVPSKLALSNLDPKHWYNTSTCLFSERCWSSNGDRARCGGVGRWERREEEEAGRTWLHVCGSVLGETARFTEEVSAWSGMLALCASHNSLKEASLSAAFRHSLDKVRWAGLLCMPWRLVTGLAPRSARSEMIQCV